MENQTNTLHTAIPSNLRVLVVDDSRMQRKLVSTHLKKWGFHIEDAESGDVALEKCKQTHFDLILSDWIMPGMTGPEFCEAFRKLERSSYGYFILLTSKSEKSDIAHGLDMGADDFLSKPVNPAELRARIKAGQRVLDMETKLHEENAKTNAALLHIQEINAALEKDLIQASELQRSLVPKSLLQAPTHSISNIFKSSGHVGGDMLGTFHLTEDRIAVYSIDVSGHGVSSALLTVQLHGMLSPNNKENNLAFKPDGRGGYDIRTPSEIATAFNDHLTGSMQTDLYFTIAYADIDLKSGRTAMVQAGHPFPVVISNANGVTRKGDGGPPIGLMPGIEFEGFEFTLKKDERLLLYSDGLTECQNSKGDLLDDEGLEELLQPILDASGPDLLQDIVWKLTEFAESDDFGDDLSAILFEFNA
ncbi:MAG: SpoIIE family protein phosphatase [Pseudomonadota bacterium]